MEWINLLNINFHFSEMVYEIVGYVYQKKIIIHIACMFYSPNDFRWDAGVF